MSCLLYCIFRTGTPPMQERPPGVAGQQVCLVPQNGLCVALSALASSEAAPSIEDALAYARVVEAFHRQRTVIPFRYGCCVEDMPAAAILLEEHRQEYEALLAELEGVDEMGIRVLFPRVASGPDGTSRHGHPKPGTLRCDSGAAYLAAQRQRYSDLDSTSLGQRTFVNELCESLSGLFARHKMEWSDSTRTGPLSLFFLVPREQLNSFREAVSRFSPKRPAHLLLSGPWPPYNFVDCREK